MMERRQIVQAAQQGDASILVTLVHVQGSSYRQPGARLLTASTKGGAYAGTISGGCLETEVVKRAAWKVRDGATVDRYSTLYDDTAEIPFGLGCGGTVDLLYETAGTPEYNALMYALSGSLRGGSFTVITWLPGGATRFARAVLAADGGIEFASQGVTPFSVANALVKGSHWDPATGGLYIERLVPPQRLFVFGAGDDAKPLVRMAALLGWSVIVADGRAQLARPERFPEAQRVVVANRLDTASLGVHSNDAVILMTHSYEQDREWLAALLPIAPRYFGVLGAKHRSSLLVSEAAAMTGLDLSTCCERIFAPVGLDLGGDGPEAIALAVISEAHARCMGKLGKSLRLSAQDVAAQVRSGAVSRYVKAQCAIPASQIV
jgi:xanthine/CO dehydrogenase XdhC/CoxF family maturation factor